jgi:mRNA interferase RelE/StbE
MDYSIVITDRALKDIEKLDAKMKERIGSKIRILVKDPLRSTRKLTDPKIGSYRLRVGDYRVIFDIEDHEIVVLRIGHRKNIYE